jgi:hypothetical protein
MNDELYRPARVRRPQRQDAAKSFAQ